MINDYYLNGLAKLMCGESFSLPSHVSFGDTDYTLDGADTGIQGEFDRNSLSSKSSSGDVAKFVGIRLASEASSGGDTVKCVGLHNSSSGSGNLCAEFLVPSLLHTQSFDLEVEFWVKHERG